MSATQSPEPSVKLLDIARRAQWLTETGWDMHISFDRSDVEAQAEARAYSERGERLNAVMQRRAQAEGVYVGDVYDAVCIF